MVELERGDREPAGWEPMGLQAAAEAVHSEGDGAQMHQAQPDAAPPGLAWEALVAVMLELVFGRLEQRDPLWKLSPGERDSLAHAWSEYLRTVAMAPGPLAGALLATGVVVGPRVIEDVRKRRAARTLDVDAQVREQGAP